MTKLADIERALATLSSAEKAQLLKWIVRDLGQSFPGIESTPGVCGGEPCIVRTRIPVWILEQMRREGVSEADILRNYPALRAEDLANAWAFILANRDDIERQNPRERGGMPPAIYDKLADEFARPRGVHPGV